jgi:arylsulfatase A-like enzyme
MFWIWFACQPTPPVTVEPEVVDSRPDVLLVTIDTLRADRLGSYGDTLAVTPNLDRFAKEGWLYSESHSITPLTLPSHSSILTGLLPREHGVRDNAGFSLDQKHRTIAEALSEVGYGTGAFISAYVLSHSWGLDQGFDLYH